MKQQDTTKAGIKTRLDQAAIDTGKSYHSGETMKLAAVRFILDTAGITDKAERAAIGGQWMATAGWFGSGNNSACRQAFETDGKTEKVLKEYAV